MVKNLAAGMDAISSIVRINNAGINRVEFVANIVFEEKREEFSGIDDKPKTERVHAVMTKCINSPITEKMCQVTVNAIVKSLRWHCFKIIY